MKIFIGCSSSEHIPNEYLEDAKMILNEIFRKDNTLVFGANNTGMMGIAHDCALQYHREIIGICPKIYQDDFQKLQCDKELIAETVSKRTEMAIEEADVLLFLPGGIGTVYELLTAMESKRSHEHDKPILVYNSHHYFDLLLATFEKMYQESFTGGKVTTCYQVINTKEELFQVLRECDKNRKE